MIMKFNFTQFKIPYIFQTNQKIRKNYLHKIFNLL